MNSQSTRTLQRQRRAPQRRRPDSNQIGPVSARRRPRTIRRAGSELQNLFQRPTDLEPSQPAVTTQYNPIRKRRLDGYTETSNDRPPKRANLTAKNLNAFDTMGGRARKTAGKKSSGESTTTTTTDKDFGTKLQQNNIICTTLDARAADDATDIRELLDRPRESEPPDQLAYERYLVLTEDYDNELSVEISAYPSLSKRTMEVEKSGYFPRPNHPWSAVDNHLTKGLSDAQPDLANSYRRSDYPPQVVEELSEDLVPSSYNEAMPAYAVEFKSSNGDMKEAKLQCAYDGALMTEGARAINKYLKRSGEGFYGKTQAITVAFNGQLLSFYGHHALQTPAQPGLTTSEAAGGEGIEYHQYTIKSDLPRESLQDFREAYKHTRNAEDHGYRLATQRKDALWAYSKAINTHTLNNTIVTPPQSSNNDAVASAVAKPKQARRTRTTDGSNEVIRSEKIRKTQV